MERLSLLADIDVGAFAWARAGFDYDWREGASAIDLDGLSQRADEMLQQMVSDGTLDPVVAEDLWYDFEDYMRRMRDPNTDLRPTPLELALMGSDDPTASESGIETWFGKQLLLGDDEDGRNHWYGVKEIPPAKPIDKKRRRREQG